MKVQQIITTVRGNDGYENSIVVKVPATWSDVEQFKAALQFAFRAFAPTTIEKFIDVEANLVGEPIEGESHV